MLVGMIAPIQSSTRKFGFSHPACRMCMRQIDDYRYLVDKRRRRIPGRLSAFSTTTRYIFVSMEETLQLDFFPFCNEVGHLRMFSARAKKIDFEIPPLDLLNPSLSLPAPPNMNNSFIKKMKGRQQCLERGKSSKGGSNIETQSGIVELNGDDVDTQPSNLDLYNQQAKKKEILATPLEERIRILACMSEFYQKRMGDSNLSIEQRSVDAMHLKTLKSFLSAPEFDPNQLTPTELTSLQLAFSRYKLFYGGEVCTHSQSEPIPSNSTVENQPKYQPENLPMDLNLLEPPQPAKLKEVLATPPDELTKIIAFMSGVYKRIINDDKYPPKQRSSYDEQQKMMDSLSQQIFRRFDLGSLPETERVALQVAFDRYQRIFVKQRSQSASSGPVQSTSGTLKEQNHFLSDDSIFQTFDHSKLNDANEMKLNSLPSNSMNKISATREIRFSDGRVLSVVEVLKMVHHMIRQSEQKIVRRDISKKSRNRYKDSARRLRKISSILQSNPEKLVKSEVERLEMLTKVKIESEKNENIKRASGLVDQKMQPVPGFSSKGENDNSDIAKPGGLELNEACIVFPQSKVSDPDVTLAGKMSLQEYSTQNDDDGDSHIDISLVDNKIKREAKLALEIDRNKQKLLAPRLTKMQRSRIRTEIRLAEKQIDILKANSVTAGDWNTISGRSFSEGNYFQKSIGMSLDIPLVDGPRPYEMDNSEVELKKMLDQAAADIGVTFNDINLLQLVLTRESTSPMPYDCLEFIGNRVLSLTVAERLIDQFPFESETYLEHRHSQFLSNETLTSIAYKLQLGKHIRMPCVLNEERGKSIDSILSNSLFAIIGALCFDGGLESAEEFIDKNWLLKDPVATLIVRNTKALAKICYKLY